MRKTKKESNDALFSAIEELDVEKLMSQGATHVSTTFKSLDEIFGGKGLAVGKMYEIAGNPDTWKSGLLYRVLGELQKTFTDKYVVLFDAEFVVQSKEDLEWIASHGVNVSKERFRLIQGNTAEEMFNKMLEISNDGDCAGWGLDSLGNMEVTSNSNAKRFTKDDSGKAKDDRVGIFAKVTGASFKLLANGVARHKQLGVIINQVRDNLSMYGGGAFNTPGGRAYKHNLSGRIEMYQKELLKKGDEIIGAAIKVVVKRSKISTAGQTNESNHLQFFNKGEQFAEAYALYNECVEAGILEQAGSWIKCTALDRKWQGKDKIYVELETSDDLKKELKELLNATNA